MTRAAPLTAIVQDQDGSPEVPGLREVDTPELGDDDVLVRVHAAGFPYQMRFMGFGFRTPSARVRAIGRPA